MKRFLSTLVIIFISIFISYNLSASGKKNNDFNWEKSIAVDATIMAQKFLSESRSDKKGLLLMKFANHLHPSYKPLLLLRAKLKYDLLISLPSTKGVGEDEFLSFLKKRVSKLKRKNDKQNRHLCLIYYTIIRLFKPYDEEALIQLMKYDDMKEEMNIEVQLATKLSTIPSHELDPEDSRYAISSITKTIKVPANVPWTDSFIKVQEGSIIKITARRVWGFGPNARFPLIDADGYTSINLNKIIDHGQKGKGKQRKKFRPPKIIKRKLKGQRNLTPGCLIAKIGKQIIPIGKNYTFRAENSGILFLGPFEWESYQDNIGYLSITITVSK